MINTFDTMEIKVAENGVYKIIPKEEFCHGRRGPGGDSSESRFSGPEFPAGFRVPFRFGDTKVALGIAGTANSSGALLRFQVWEISVAAGRDKRLGQTGKYLQYL